MHSCNSPKYKTSRALCKYGELYVLNCFISGSSFQSFRLSLSFMKTEISLPCGDGKLTQKRR